MISTFINTTCLAIAIVLIFIECQIGKKIVANTYSLKYEGRYIYDPEKLAKTKKNHHYSIRCQLRGCSY